MIALCRFRKGFAPISAAVVVGRDVSHGNQCYQDEVCCFGGESTGFGFVS